MSSSVAAVGLPPDAETEKIGPTPEGVKRITLSRFQVPPRRSAASQRVETGPPFEPIFLSFPVDAKPMNLPSGDQNGIVAPSVPASGRAEASSKARTQSCARPSPFRAANTSLFPSGDTATGPAAGQRDSSVVPSGASTLERTSGAVPRGARPRQRTQPTTTTDPRAAPASAHTILRGAFTASVRPVLVTSERRLRTPEISRARSRVEA